MTNVKFDDYIKSFFPFEKRNFIPKKYMTQEQIGIFKFGHPETQTDEAFVCIINPIKLSPEAPEFIPASIMHSVHLIVLGSFLICPTKILIPMMMNLLVHMKQVKLVPTEILNVLILI